jgi:hypothetical protein
MILILILTPSLFVFRSNPNPKSVPILTIIPKSVPDLVPNINPDPGLSSNSNHNHNLNPNPVSDLNPDSDPNPYSDLILIRFILVLFPGSVSDPIPVSVLVLGPDPSLNLTYS